MNPGSCPESLPLSPPDISSSSPYLGDSPALEGRTILLIDDDPLIHQLVRVFLEDYGFDPLVAIDGADGLALAQSRVPDLILLDLRMPGLDGFEVCARLKADPRTTEIPILFFSAVGEEQQKLACFGLGAVDYITKPVSRGELAARILVHLRQRLSLLALQQRLSAEEARSAPSNSTEQVDAGANLPARRAAQVEKAIALLDEHLLDPLTLDALASAVGSNVKRLSRDFQLVHGITVFGWIKEQRLQRAAKLLRTTDLPIQAIADNLGFCTPSHLTRLFRARFKVTPREYRGETDA